MRVGLVRARIDSLTTQGDLIVSVLAEGATIGDPVPEMLHPQARRILKRLDLPPTVTARLYDADGSLVGDYALLSDQVDQSELPELSNPNIIEQAVGTVSDMFDWISRGLQSSARRSFIQRQSFEEELRASLRGERVAGERLTENGQRLVSVSIPVQRVQAVVGVLTLEASDVSEIVRRERGALLPFIGVAILMSLISAGFMTWMVARPLRRLALAADRVRAGAAERLELPTLTRRQDEIGDLAGSLEAMTEALFDRIIANEAFAADVAHELKNPLTSIRSAVETLERVEDPDAKDRLRAVIASDVRRLDRLITDISNATRLEAEIARSPNEAVNLAKLLSDLAETYDAVRDEGDPHVRFIPEEPDQELIVRGRETPLGQVFRNLIENARSFSPPDGQVTIRARLYLANERLMAEVAIEDEGPGIPSDKLEKIFDRFYTDRPAGAKFGLNSGLGLSIVRQIVEGHRGEVEAANRMDASGEVEGARFIVTLPALAPSKQ